MLISEGLECFERLGKLQGRLEIFAKWQGYLSHRYTQVSQ